MGRRDRPLGKFHADRRLHVWFIAALPRSFLWVSLDFICALRCLESFAPILLCNMLKFCIMQHSSRIYYSMWKEEL